MIQDLINKYTELLGKIRNEIKKSCVSNFEKAKKLLKFAYTIKKDVNNINSVILSYIDHSCDPPMYSFIDYNDILFSLQEDLQDNCIDLDEYNLVVNLIYQDVLLGIRGFIWTE